jgi:hypothetical protein
MSKIFKKISDEKIEIKPDNILTEAGSFSLMLCDSFLLMIDVIQVILWQPKQKPEIYTENMQQ